MGGKHSSEKLFEKVTKTIRDAANQGAKEIGESFEIVEKAISDGTAKISQVDGKVTITYDVKSDDNIENEVNKEIDKIGKQIKKSVEKSAKNGLKIDYPIDTHIVTRKSGEKEILKSVNTIGDQLESAYKKASTSLVDGNDTDKNNIANFIQKYIAYKNIGGVIPKNIEALFANVTGGDADKDSNKEAKQAFAEYANFVESEVKKIIDRINQQKEATKQLREEQKKTTSALQTEKHQNKDDVASSIDAETNAIKNNTDEINRNVEAQKSDDSSNQKKEIDNVAKAYEEATEILKKYYDLKQKEYSDGKFNDNDTLKEYKAELDDAINHVNKYTATTEEAIEAQKKFDDIVANYKNSFSRDIRTDLDSDFRKYENKNNKTSEYKNIIKNIRSEIDKLNVPIDFTNPKEIEELHVAEEKIRNMMKNLGDRKFDLISDEKINSSLNSAYKSLNKDTKAPEELRNKIRKVIAEFENLKNVGKEVDGVTFDRLQKELKEVQIEIQKTGKTGASFGDKVKKKFGDVAAYFATYVSIQDGIQILRQGFETIKEYDTVLTEMNKVSDESISTLKEFQTESFKLANAIGTTASQIQNSTADWMRLGESIEEAKKSAEASNILFNVSEFESIDAATSSLVSMSQAYKDLEKMDIVDIMNNIGNNYAISTDGLATALQKSASSLTTAGNDINEAVALITAGNTVAQDPDSVGAGLRTISLRLVGTEAAKEELESLGEETDDVITTTSKLRDTIISATKAATSDGKGFDIFDANGNYKSTYEIMLGLSELYDDIVAKDKELGTNNLNLLLETIAGKNRSNIAASILQNSELLESVYNSSLDSEGSATKENEAYLESIEGHLQQIKNLWDNLWVSENNREFINFFLDIAKAILEAANEFGAFKTLLVGGGGLFTAFKAFKGEGKQGYKNVLVS